MTDSENALGLEWVFSFNEKVLDGVHSLCTDQRKALFYTAAHTGVIYDYVTRTQLLLQGHRNVITCCAVSADKRWVVTADAGPDSLLAVWDSVSGTPIKTIFSPHARGVQALDLSADALYIVTLSHVEGEEKQELGIWAWAEEERDEALHLETIPSATLQHCARFNRANPGEIVTNGPSQAIFWDWNETSLTLYSPRLGSKGGAKDLRLTVSCFVDNSPSSALAITGSGDGRVVMWDVPYLATSHHSQRPQRCVIKSIQLCQGRITHLSSVKGRYICVAGEDGAVRFYDLQFRIEGWFEDLNAGPVTSVSFACCPAPAPLTPNGVTAEEDPTFSVPDFVVGTELGYIVGVESRVLEEMDAERRRGSVLVQGLNDAVHALAAHPTMSRLAIGCHNGSVQLWDYDKKVLLMVRNFEKPKLRPHTVTWDPSGHFLLVGFVSGQLKMLDGERLHDVMTSETADCPISMIRFSPDGRYFATADVNHHVGLWAVKSEYGANNTRHEGDHSKNSQRTPTRKRSTHGHHTPVHERGWSYVGRRRSHSGPITGLEFGRREHGADVLVSVGEDRRLVEYDLINSSVTQGLVLVGEPRLVEQTGVPTTCMWHPRMPGDMDDRLITANSQLKLKQWNADSLSCRFTTLAPSFGANPVTRLLSVPCPSPVKGMSVHSTFVAYATSQQVIGVLKLPLDGSPDKWMGLIAHPGPITCIDVAKDGLFLFSAGGADRCVNMWKVATSALDATEAIGGGGLGPFLRLLEGGEDGPLHQELRDYFTYTQLRMQGEECTATRVAEGRIPVTQLPVMMRALGVCPTEREVDDMMNEVRYRDFSKHGAAVDSLDLETFTKLYVNHRPAFPLDKNDIEKAFEAVGGGPSVYHPETGLGLNKLTKALETLGEPISKNELKALLCTLTGDGSLPGSGGKPGQGNITAAQFIETVLGFEVASGEASSETATEYR